jgi:cytidylate kinase
MGQSGYLADLARTVGTFAREGRVVILGRGANWFLSGKYGLKLRAVAPFEQRVASHARRSKVDEKSARVQVERHDRDQRAFIRQTFNRDINDPLGYDIVLNLGTISLDQAADIAVAALRRKVGGQD